MPKAVTLKAAPTTWDCGANGPANRIRLAEEPATDYDPERNRETPNPNGVRRWRRQTMISTYAAGGHITPEQAAAADRLTFAAYGQSERDPYSAIHVKVPASRDPHAARIDARREFLAMWATIPTSSRPVIERVVLDDQPVWHGNTAQRERHMHRLRTGLDAIA